MRLTNRWVLATSPYNPRIAEYDYTIYKVYDISKSISIFDIEDSQILWEYDPAPIKMTMQQICDTWGYEIEIVK